MIIQVEMSISFCYYNRIGFCLFFQKNVFIINNVLSTARFIGIFFCFAYDFVWSESSLELFIWIVCIKLLYMTMTLVNSTNVFAHCKTKFQMKIILNGMRPYAAKKNHHIIRWNVTTQFVQFLQKSSWKCQVLQSVIN